MFRSILSPAAKSQRVQPQSGQPLRLVFQDANGKFVMDPAAIAALKKIRGPLAVVSVCGRARQGKSFVLNQLLGRSNGFVVGPTHRPCTKGLWMWSTGVSRRLPDGSPYHLLLLDTEGIEAYDQTGQYSTQIFSLAVLLSSLFIFNQMGGIDEAALDNLALVTEMTKHIRVKAGNEAESSSTEDLAEFSPIFVWLLRDFYLDLTENGRKITPKDYLEQALQNAPGNSKSVAAKNEIRDSIRALFPARECFALVRPLNNERDLQRLDQQPIEKLRPKFREGLEALTNFVFQKAKPKKMGTATLTGPILAALTQSYLDALNAGAVPTIATSWQGVEEQQCRAAMDAGIAEYESLFDKSGKADELALKASHTKAVSAAMETFNQEAIGTGDVRKRFEAQLREKVEKTFEDYKERVFVEADLRCSQILSSFEVKLQSMAGAKDTNVESLIKLLEDQTKEYEAVASGPSKWPRYAKFLQSCIRGALSSHFHHNLTAALQRCQALQSKADALQEASTEARNAEKRARADADEWRRQAGALGTKFTALEGEAARCRDEMGRLAASLDGAKRQLAEAKAKEAEARRALEASKGKLRLALADVARWRGQAEAGARLHQREAEVTSAAQRQEREALEREHRAALGKKESALEQLKSQHKEEVEKITKLSSHLKDREAEVSSLRRAISAVRSDLAALQARASLAESRAREAELEAVDARSALTRIEDELQGAQRALRQSEAARSAAELGARRSAELANQAEQRAGEASGKLLRLEEAVREREAVEKFLTSRAEAAEKMVSELRISGDSQSRRWKEKAESEKAEAEESLVSLRKEYEEAMASLAEVRESESLNALQLREFEGREEALKKRVEELEAEVERMRAEGRDVQTAVSSRRVGKKRQRRMEDDGEGSEGVAEMETDHSLEGGEGGGKMKGKMSLEFPEEDVGLDNQEAGMEALPEFTSPRRKGSHRKRSSQPGSEVGEEFKNVTKQELKRRITDAGFAHELLAIRNPSKGQLADICVKNAI